MTGRLIWKGRSEPAESNHLRARIKFDRGSLLFYDTRRFGTLTWHANRSEAAPFMISNDGANWHTSTVNQRLAPEALPGSFDDQTGTSWVPLHTGFKASPLGVLLFMAVQACVQDRSR